jgi:hypothetical protein
MSNMGSHVPFEYLKHKLWLKEGSGITPIYLRATGVPRTIGKILTKGIQLFFRPHINQRFAQEVMGLQSCENPNFRNFEIPNLGVLGQNDIWVSSSWLSIENTTRGKVVVTPKFESWWVLWLHVCSWFVRAPKVLQLRTNQLVWFVHVHVSNWLACHSS